MYHRAVRRTLLKLAPVLRLTRVTTAFAAVANVWFVILWTRAGLPDQREVGTHPIQDGALWLLLLGGAINALGLFAYGAALNDILDATRDRAFNPDRPIPSGRLAVDRAVSLAVGTVMIALLGATVLGIEAVVLTIVVACAILFFHAVGKFVPAVGLVSLGLIYAGQMVVPNLYINFVWPVWLVMTHALLVGGISHVVGKKIPVISRRAFVAAVLGWAFWSTVMFYAAWERTGREGIWPDDVPPLVAIGPAALAVLFSVVAIRRVRSLGFGARAAEKILRYGALWLALYACAWLVGMQYWLEAGLLGVLTGLGFLGMTVVREAYAMVEHPLGYRL